MNTPWPDLVTRPVRPVDWVLAAYNTVLAVLWLGLSGLVWYAAPLCAAHAAAAFLPALLGRSSRPVSRPVGWLREAYPLLWIPALWVELDPLIRWLHGTSFDPAILALDLAVFGVHLDRVWMPSMPQVWFSELMFFAYWAYLPLIFLPPIWMAATRRGAAFRDMTLRLATVYVACYLLYVAFPVVGPHEFGQPYEGPLTQGFFYGLVAGAHQNGNVWGAAFPSSHVAAAVTIAYLGWRWLPRVVALLLTLEAIGVILSTVYTQNHYAVDSLAGIVWGLAIQFALVPLLLAAPQRKMASPRWRAALARARVPDGGAGGGA